MPKLRTLMNRYKKGELTKAQYEAEVAKLLEEDIIDQEQHDDALVFDPEADKPIFTQDDVDRMVAAKAVKMVRKALKDAGVEVDAPNKDLLTKVAEMAKGGTGTEGGGKATDQDLEKLKKLEAKVPGLEAKAKDLTIENAVLKAAGGLKPVNPIQVVRALKADYMDLVEIDDETGAVDTKSVDRALKRIATAEPNLFHAEGGDDDGEGGDNGGQAGGFRGKGPGGGTGGGKGGKDLAKQKEEAREMLRKAGIQMPDNK